MLSFIGTLILAHFAGYPNGQIIVPAGFTWTPYTRRDRIMDENQEQEHKKVSTNRLNYWRGWQIN
ncbi:MAG: hypothetical protein DLM72_12570 [Candidatus Nitrosopolaris wilkensis]|nr:MAG: hypothetical protein DLM72_12570 [Candidatus Nitrosopolaris wilkensis]